MIFYVALILCIDKLHKNQYHIELPYFISVCLKSEMVTKLLLEAYTANFIYSYNPNQEERNRYSFLKHFIRGIRKWGKWIHYARGKCYKSQWLWPPFAEVNWPSLARCKYLLLKYLWLLKLNRPDVSLDPAFAPLYRPLNNENPCNYLNYRVKYFISVVPLGLVIMKQPTIFY